MRNQPGPYSDKSPKDVDKFAKLAGEVARLTAISELQSKNLAQAMFEKNEALKVVTRFNSRAFDCEQLQQENADLKAHIRQAREAFSVIRKAFNTLASL